MAHFTPNLEDGEWWLPSDIFPADETPAFKSRLNSFHSPHFTSYRDDLTHHFAECTLHRRNLHKQTLQIHSLPPFLTSPCYRTPAGQNGFTAALQGGAGVTSAAFGAKSMIMTGSAPVYKYQSVIPVQPQVERVRAEVEARESVLQRQQNYVLGNPRVRPLEQGTDNVGFGISRGGEYRGTGVFIPRSQSITSQNNAKATTRSKRSLRSKQANQVSSHRNSMKKLDMRKEVERRCQLPPELALPQEWTY